MVEIKREVTIKEIFLVIDEPGICATTLYCLFAKPVVLSNRAKIFSFTEKTILESHVIFREKSQRLIQNLVRDLKWSFL